METIKIAYGNQFSIFIPFVLLDGDDETVLDASTLTDVVVKVGKACNWVTKTHTIADEKIVVTFDATTEVGYYDFVITAKYNGRDIAARPQQVFAVVEWNDESNFCDFIFGGECIAPTQAVIGEYVTTAELEALKTQLQTKIAEAEAAKEAADEAKEEWEEKAEALDDVATETNATANKNAILDAIDDIELDTSTLATKATQDAQTATLATLATESNATANKTAILDAIDDIDIDTSTLATKATQDAQTATLATLATETNATANKNAILTAISGIDTSTLAKQGTDSTATLTAVQVETDKIGTAGSGQANTLFGAIAAISGGLSVVTCTETEYAALTPVVGTLYFVFSDPS